MTTPTAAEVERARNIATRAVRAGRNLPPSTFGCCSTPEKEREWRAPEVEPIQRITDEIAAEFAADREARDAAQARAGALAEALGLLVEAYDGALGTGALDRSYPEARRVLAQTDAEALAALRASAWEEAAKVLDDLAARFRGTGKMADAMDSVAFEKSAAALRDRGKA